MLFLKSTFSAQFYKLNQQKKTGLISLEQSILHKIAFWFIL